MTTKYIGGGMARLVCDVCGARSAPTRPVDTPTGRTMHVEGWKAARRDGQPIVTCPDCNGSAAPVPLTDARPAHMTCELCGERVTAVVRHTRRGVVHGWTGHLRNCPRVVGTQRRLERTDGR